MNQIDRNSSVSNGGSPNISSDFFEGKLLEFPDTVNQKEII